MKLTTLPFNTGYISDTWHRACIGRVMYYSTESVLKHSCDWTVYTIIHECSFIVETSCTDHSWYLTVYTIIHRCGFIADTSYFLRSQYQYCINNIVPRLFT